MRIRRVLSLAGAAVLAIAALGHGSVPAGADPAVPFSNDLSDYVYGAGSDTTYALMTALGDAYNASQGCNQGFPHGAACAPPPQAGVVKTENYDHEVVVNRFPTGSVNGRLTLCAQQPVVQPAVPFVHYARSSAGPAVDGCTQSGLVLRFVAFARDAVAPVTWGDVPGSPAAGVGSLTQAQLNDIFVDCTITNWSQVGGADAPIEVWGLFPGSGTRSSWDGFVGGNSLRCVQNLAHVVHPNDVAPIEALGGFQDAIVPFAVALHISEPARAGASTMVAVNGVAPTFDTVRSGAFPFSRDVYNVYRQAGPGPVASAAAVGFAGENGWVCKPQALHSEPPGTPGGGIEDPLAVRDYGQLVVDVMVASGFVPKAASGNLCTATSVTVP
jgi:ABC-type phosphate transport system substrate-binding protein